MEGGFRIYNVEPLSEKARVGKFIITLKLYMIYNVQCLILQYLFCNFLCVID